MSVFSMRVGILVTTFMISWAIAKVSVRNIDPVVEIFQEDIQTLSPDRFEELASAYHKAKIFDGVVAVATLDEVVFKGSYGLSNIEFGVPYQTDTRIRLASVSKIFTAAIILRLEEEGKLSTDQTVANLLPRFLKKPFGKVKVSQLLSHTSGIPNYQYKTPYESLQKKVLLSRMGNIPVTLADMIKTFADEPLDFTPGKQYSYSNANYVLLQAIIEKQTKSPFEVALKKYILDPVGLKNTGVLDHRSVIKTSGGICCKAWRI